VLICGVFDSYQERSLSQSRSRYIHVGVVTEGADISDLYNCMI